MFSCKKREKPKSALSLISCEGFIRFLLLSHSFSFSPLPAVSLHHFVSSPIAIALAMSKSVELFWQIGQSGQCLPLMAGIVLT